EDRVIVHDPLWQAWENPFPEQNTALHLIVSPKRHVVDSTLLTSEEWMVLREVLRKLKDLFSYTSRGVLMRDGDATLSAGTIEHLHIHIMVPNGTGRVESPFYKGAEDEEKGVRRAIVYEKVRQGQQLTLEDTDLVKDRL
ncbi:HIT domain-containing protein, partial [Candidatus Parcubacteria bacterium]|nr:HIT domain-containing protein [Candidatus Parcubacteria bacterium]